MPLWTSLRSGRRPAARVDVAAGDRELGAGSARCADRAALAAGHEAAPLRAPSTPPLVPRSTSSRPRPASRRRRPYRVAPVRVAAVDDDVAGLEHRGQLVEHRIDRRPGREVEEDRARRGQQPRADRRGREPRPRRPRPAPGAARPGRSRPPSCPARAPAGPARRPCGPCRSFRARAAFAYLASGEVRLRKHTGLKRNAV